jgi:hypothetical protein
MISEAVFKAGALRCWHAEGVRPAEVSNPDSFELLREIGIKIERKTPRSQVTSENTVETIYS